MRRRWQTMWNLNEEEYPETTTNEYSDDLGTRLELLPIEVLEIIFSHLRPADLVAVAESSSHLERVVRSARLWRTSKLQLTSDSVPCFLLQLGMAPELQELEIGTKNAGVATAAVNFDGLTPRVGTFSLIHSELNTQLGVALLEKYGRKSRHIKLDLTHGPLEPPRHHLALFQLLETLHTVESVSVRIDSVKDIVILNQIKVKLVDIDIHHLKIGGLLEGLGQFLGVAAAKLISVHGSHLKALRLPPTFDLSLCRVVETCKDLRTLACNVWTLPEIEHLENLHTLIVLPPYSNISVQDVHGLITYARRARNVLGKLKELRFVNSDADNDVMSLPPSSDFAQALVCLLLVLCHSLEVLEVEWDVGDIAASEQAWFSMVLLNNAQSLREMRLHGNTLLPQHFVSLARYCCNLKILDVRSNSATEQRAGRTKRKQAGVALPTLKIAFTLLPQAIPNLTVISDEDVEDGCDWNSYPSRDESTDVTEASGSSGECQNFLLDTQSLNPGVARRLYSHTLSLNRWAYNRSLSNEDPQTWRCATLDSSAWSNDEFTAILRLAPALGLLDCRNREELSPGKKGHQWFNSVIRGPSHIEALRIRAVLVSAHLWKMMVPVLLRVGNSLRRLELDFRGRPYRDWRIVLSVFHSLPNLKELVLRGSFEDDKPVLDWLHGQVRSLTRLDLKDCLMSDSSKMPAFEESLRKLLLELRGTLQGVALPPLPHQLAAPMLRIVSELTDLTEVALHANELECLRPLTSLQVLELYGDRSIKSRHSVDRLAFNLRSMSDTFKLVEKLTLPVAMFKSHFVQEAIFDVMPKLRRLEVTSHNKKKKICAQGPQCRSVINNLC